MFGGLESVNDLERMLRMLEVAYIEQHGLDVDDENSKDLFPDDWEIDKNYDEKIDIIVAAIDKEEIIVNTDEYQKYKGDFFNSR